MVIQVLPSKVVNINYHAIIIGQCNTQVVPPLGSWGVLVLFLYVILELYQYQCYSKQKLTWFPEFVLHLCPEIICFASMHVFFIKAHLEGRL